MKVETSASPAPRSKVRTTSGKSIHRGWDSERVKGAKADVRMTINRSAEDLFAFWRNFENLPQLMEHIESVECLDVKRSHWRARRVKDEADNPIEWDMEVINERPNEMIAWRTLEGSDLQHAGSIWFTPAPGDIETEVKLEVAYENSGFADFIARLTRRFPAQQMREELRNFKQLMEAGELPTTAGQPASRTDDVIG